MKITYTTADGLDENAFYKNARLILEDNPTLKTKSITEGPRSYTCNAAGCAIILKDDRIAIDGSAEGIEAIAQEFKDNGFLLDEVRE